MSESNNKKSWWDTPIEISNTYVIGAITIVVFGVCLSLVLLP